MNQWLICAGFAALMLIVFIRITPRNVQVVDGDSITTTRRRWRLGGYDAPEWNQPGGKQAHAHLAMILAQGRTFGIFAGNDVYGRSLVHIMTRKGPLSWRMIASGHGHAETAVGHIIQLWARVRGKGLWGLSEPAILPSLWRQMHAPRDRQQMRTQVGGKRIRMPRIDIRHDRTRGLRLPGGFYIG